MGYLAANGSDIFLYIDCVPGIIWERGATWTISGEKKKKEKKKNKTPLLSNFSPGLPCSCHCNEMKTNSNCSPLWVYVYVCVQECVQTYYMLVCICSAFLSDINGGHLESVSQCVYCFHRWSSDTVWITEINDSHCGSADWKNNSQSHTRTHTHTRIYCMCLRILIYSSIQTNTQALHE